MHLVSSVTTILAVVTGVIMGRVATHAVAALHGLFGCTHAEAVEAIDGERDGECRDNSLFSSRDHGIDKIASQRIANLRIVVNVIIQSHSEMLFQRMPLSRQAEPLNGLD